MRRAIPVAPVPLIAVLIAVFFLLVFSSPVRGQIDVAVPAPGGVDIGLGITVIESLDQVVVTSGGAGSTTASLFDRDLGFIGTLEVQLPDPPPGGLLGVTYHPPSDTLYWVSGISGSIGPFLYNTDTEGNFIEQFEIDSMEAGKNLTVSPSGKPLPARR